MTRKEQLRFVKRSPSNIHKIYNPEVDIKWAAIKAFPQSIKYIQNQDQNIQFYIINYYPHYIKFIKNITYESLYKLINKIKSWPYYNKNSYYKVIKWNDSNLTIKELIKLIQLDPSIYNFFPSRYKSQELELIFKIYN